MISIYSSLLFLNIALAEESKATDLFSQTGDTITLQWNTLGLNHFIHSVTNANGGLLAMDDKGNIYAYSRDGRWRLSLGGAMDDSEIDSEEILLDVESTIEENANVEDEDRFPPKVNTVFADPVHAIGMLPFGQYCYHFITTHSHSMDQDILNQIHDRELRWLGMIGSQAKKYRFIKRMVASGVDPSVLEHLNTPAGLDIGAETPAEIAISVLADLVRHRRMK